MVAHSDLLRALRDENPPYVAEVADKLVTKARAVELGMAVPKLFRVFDRPEDLSVAKLPAAVVLKRNIDPSKVLCLRDRVDQYGRRWNDSALRRWMKEVQRFRTIGGRPVLVMAEEHLLSASSVVPEDYKVFAIRNKARFIMMHYGKFVDSKQVIYTADWVRTRYHDRASMVDHDFPDHPRPAQLEEIKDFCERFARTWPAPTMRIDFYIVEGRLFFGEAGIIHRACAPVHPEWDLEMGRMWLEGSRETLPTNRT
jgi:hypothetical protein